jgi:hypothetical protein
MAQEDGGIKLRNKRKNPLVKTRIGISPVIGLYKPNKNHTKNTQQKKSFCISVREEFRLDKTNREFLMIGAEYMLHGLSFNSYYFYSDSLKLYNGAMNYRYNLTLHEIDFPILLKHSFQKETNKIYSSYIFAGYNYRCIIASQLKVNNNGNELVNSRQKITFKSPAFNPVNSSFFCAGFGIQKNIPLDYRAFFAEIQFKYGLSPFYFNDNFTPSSLYTTGHFIYATVGYKF